MLKNKLVNLLLVIIALLLVTVFGLSVRPAPSADKIAIFRIEGIACSRCAAVLIGTTLEAEKGVAAAAVDETAGRMVVSYNSRVVSPKTLEGTITAKGFGCRALQVQTVEQYRSVPGAQIPVRHSGGCCCAGEKTNHKEALAGQ